MGRVCVNCGRMLGDTEKFCGGCGAQVEAEEAGWGGKELFDLGMDQQTMPQKKRKKAVLPVILGAVLVIAAVAAVLLWRTWDEEDVETSGKKKDSQSAQLSTEPTRPAVPEVTEPVITEPAPTEPEPDEPVLTHGQYMAADIDTPVTVECYVQATQSWWDNKITVYAQDRDGGYFLYEMACSREEAARLTPGTKIRVSGYKALFSGEIEIMDATFEIVESADRFVAEPLNVTDLLGTEELIEHQNEKVCFKGVTVADIRYKNGQTGDDIYVDVKWNNAIYSFCVERYLTGPETDVYKAVAGLNSGDTVDIEGFLYWYEGVNTHITAVEKVEITADLLANNRKKINVFLSNFAEQDFQGHPSTAFAILKFAMDYCYINRDDLFLPDQETGLYYIERADVETVMKDFFGRVVEPWQCEVDPGTGGYVDRGVIYEDGWYGYEGGDVKTVKRFAVARSMEDTLGDTYFVEFDIYEVKSGTVKSSCYSLSAEEAARSADLRRVDSGTATIVEYTRSTGKESYQLVDYCLDY